MQRRRVLMKHVTSSTVRTEAILQLHVVCRSSLTSCLWLQSVRLTLRCRRCAARLQHWTPSQSQRQQPVDLGQPLLRHL